MNNPDLLGDAPPTPKKRATKAEKPRPEMTPGFERFWKVYPKRIKHLDSLRKWHEMGLEEKAPMIVAHLERRVKDDAQWHKGYIQDPITFMNQERWLDDYERRPTPGQARPGAPAPADAPSPGISDLRMAKLNIAMLAVLAKNGAVSPETLAAMIAEKNRIRALIGDREYTDPVWAKAMTRARELLTKVMKNDHARLGERSDGGRGEREESREQGAEVADAPADSMGNHL